MYSGGSSGENLSCIFCWTTLSVIRSLVRPSQGSSPFNSSHMITPNAYTSTACMHHRLTAGLPALLQANFCMLLYFCVHTSCSASALESKQPVNLNTSEYHKSMRKCYIRPSPSEAYSTACITRSSGTATMLLPKGASNQFHVWPTAHSRQVVLDCKAVFTEWSHDNRLHHVVTMDGGRLHNATLVRFEGMYMYVTPLTMLLILTTFNAVATQATGWDKVAQATALQHKQQGWTCAFGSSIVDQCMIQHLSSM